jgi:hypothetical protein
MGNSGVVAITIKNHLLDDGRTAVEKIIAEGMSDLSGK